MSFTRRRYGVIRRFAVFVANGGMLSLRNNVGGERWSFSREKEAKRILQCV